MLATLIKKGKQMVKLMFQEILRLILKGFQVECIIEQKNNCTVTAKQM